MRHLIVFTIYLTAFALLTACSPESSEIRAVQPYVAPKQEEIPTFPDVPDQKFDWVTQNGGESQLEFNPRVDILFVTDNSESMKSAQENLVKNIDRFTAGIVRNKMIDYHIGVISCWDSSDRYARTKKDAYQMGDLRFAKDRNGTLASKRFVSKADYGQLSIAQTLKIGVTAYAEGGPEVEEFFSPLAATIKNTGRGAANEDFFRDDAQLVVIMMTDADDSTSRITPEEMAKMLIEFKGGNPAKITAYGVLVRASDSDEYKDWDLRIHPKYHPECFDMTSKAPKNNGTCTGFAPERLEQFIVAADSHLGKPDDIRKNYIMGITSQYFGSDLAKIGDDITFKVLEKVIYLKQRPRVTPEGQIMLRVRYGTEKQLALGKGQIISQNRNSGWMYDAQNNAIMISGKTQYDYQESARFAVDMIPVTIKQ